MEELPVIDYTPFFNQLIELCSGIIVLLSFIAALLLVLIFVKGLGNSAN